jgi:hypothetical protein
MRIFYFDESRGGSCVGFWQWFSRRFKKLLKPPEYAVSSHLASHSPHSSPPLLFWHVVGLADLVGNLLYVEGIDKERVSPQLLSSSRKFAQDEYTIGLDARSTVLLCNEVHPVFEGGNECYLARSIMGHKLGA